MHFVRNRMMELSVLFEPKGVKPQISCGKKAGLKYVYAGNIPIPGTEDTYCANDKKALIVRSGFTVLKNVLKDGKCPYCGEAVSGVWG